MKQRELEMKLQEVPGFTEPRPEMEQYVTPARIAADILFFAYAMGDIMDMRVADLGCGTGIFAYGAALLGADRVLGIDSDEASIDTAREFCGGKGVDIEFLAADISVFAEEVDTVVQNPPFGAQNKGAFKPFIERALAAAQAVYTLHQSGMRHHVERVAGQHSGTVTHTKDYKFEIGYTFPFHRKDVQSVDVTLLRIERAVN